MVKGPHPQQGAGAAAQQGQQEQRPFRHPGGRRGFFSFRFAFHLSRPKARNAARLMSTSQPVSSPWGLPITAKPVTEAASGRNRSFFMGYPLKRQKDWPGEIPASPV